MMKKGFRGIYRRWPAGPRYGKNGARPFGSEDRQSLLPFVIREILVGQLGQAAGSEAITRGGHFGEPICGQGRDDERCQAASATVSPDDG